ncbi:polysaccharide biosynthesis tyrosine autokinase [Thermanaerothrix sp.]|uniref:polysaccharide biosynthesis tyrosine autokinase n=1 Tax=Thermanaerothrix sp. TaxID=2972675 RepID=UPI002ADD7F10|nr:polysaccharide biosynthesis tyrosine autokinase [Thermanaerothrix sp.]
MDYLQDSDSYLEEIDLRYYLGLVWRYLWLVVLALVLGAGAGYGISQLQSPVYEAKTQVMVTRSSSQQSVTDLTQTLNTQQLTQTYAELLSQDWLRQIVSQRTGVEITKDQIKIKTTTNAPIIYISVEHSDPGTAVKIANTLVEVLIEQNNSIQAGRYSEAEESLNLQISEMEKKIADVQAELEKSRESTYQKQLQDAQNNIETARSKLFEVLEQLAQIKAIGTTAQAQYLLQNAQAQREYLQGQGGTSSEQTSKQIQDLDQYIAWLTPLAQPGAIESKIADLEKQRDEQQALLSSYQEAYNRLLNANVAEITSQEIKELENTLSLYQQIYLNLLSNRENVRLQKLQNMPNVVQIFPAIASDAPIRPRPLLNMGIGGAAGLFLALAIIFLRDALDTTVHSKEDLERKVGLPVLGMIAKIEDTRDAGQPYVDHKPRSPIAETFRKLRTNLEFASVDTPLKLIVVTSALPSEGKTTIALNLAAIYAQGGKRVAVVDADLRKPMLHRITGLSNRIGLTDLFRSDMPMKEILRNPNGNERLYLITSGKLPPNPGELLASMRMGQILEHLSNLVDLIILDTPPMLVAADAQILAARSDGVLIVAEPYRTPIESLKASVEALRRVNARVLGAVFNRVPPQDHYYSYYYYREYKEKEDDYNNRRNAKPTLFSPKKETHN